MASENTSTQVNEYNKRVFMFDQAAINKRLKALDRWQCGVCTFINSGSSAICKVCDTNKVEGGDKSNPLRMHNPYAHYTINKDVPFVFKGKSYMSPMSTNMAPNMTSFPQIIPTLPQTLPPFIQQKLNNNKQTITLPSINNLNSNYEIPIGDTMSNLHPSLLSNINASVAEFKQAITKIPPRVSANSINNNNNNNNKNDEATNWDKNNILGAEDWININVSNLLDSFGKKIQKIDIDRLYAAIQRYIKENPNGPFKGDTFWNKIAYFSNSTRTGSSWKTHWNSLTKNDKKSGYRTSQLQALKGLIRDKRINRSVKNQLTPLTQWTEEQERKKKKAEELKAEADKQVLIRKNKLDELLNIAIADAKQPKNNSINNNNNNESKTVAENTKLQIIQTENKKVERKMIEPEPIAKQSDITVSDMKKLCDLSSIEEIIETRQEELLEIEYLIGEKNRDEALNELKDVIDDFEDNKNNIIDDKLDELKTVLYVDLKNETERDVLVCEYQRLATKYYGEPAIIINKLLNIHKIYNSK